MTGEDLAGHRSDWCTPLSIAYGDLELHELPPNTQGIAPLIALGLCRHLDLDGLDPDGPDAVHLMIEAMKLALADAYAHVGDPDWMSVDPAILLDDGYLRERAKAIDPAQAADPPPGEPKAAGTVYIAAADDAGMMVSLIQSCFYNFGSGIVVPGTGIKPARPRFRLLPGGGASQPGRPAQAAVPDDHPRLPDRERPSGDEFRRHGRVDATAGTCADGFAHPTVGPEPAGRQRRAALADRVGQEGGDGEHLQPRHGGGAEAPRPSHRAGARARRLQLRRRAGWCTRSRAATSPPPTTARTDARSGSEREAGILRDPGGRNPRQPPRHREVVPGRRRAGRCGALPREVANSRRDGSCRGSRSPSASPPWLRPW